MPGSPHEESVIYPADLELVQGALAREPDALRHLAERAACVPGFLKRRAARLGIRLHAAALDDLTQETYLALWRKLSTYRGEARLETWACGFAFIELRRFRERRGREPVANESPEEDPLQEPSLPDDLAELVDRVLEDLGSPADEIIRLKHFEELTFEAIARRLELSPNTAKSHYYRGLARLRDRLGAKGEELTG